MNIKKFTLEGLYASAAVVALTVFASSTVIFAQPVTPLAETATYKFDIPSQDLGAAFRALGSTANLQLVFDAATVRGKRNAPVIGTYSVDDALARLLAGSGVFAQRTSAGVIAIKTLPPISKISGSSDDLDEIIVNAKRIASTATKFKLRVIDTPQSIKAVTRDVLEFASVRDFTDLVKIDASTNTNGTVQGYPHLSFRGLDMNFSTGIKIDGTPSLAGFPVDFAVFERIEILKGPSSTIYGQNSVGGMVNAVTKRPLSEFKGSVEGKIGSWGFHRAEADIGGPLTKDGKLSFRGVAAYEEGGSFVDFTSNQSKVVYGALKYDFDEATSATLVVNYQERGFRPNKGITLFYDTKEIPDVPASRNFGPDWVHANGKLLATEAEVSHKFANNWTLRANIQYGDTSRYGTGYGFFGFVDHNGDGVDDTGDPQSIEAYFNDSGQDMWSGDISLTGDFDLFGTRNTFYLSVDHRVTNSDGKDAYAGVGRPNIFHPDYAAMNPPLLTSDAIGDAGGYGYVSEDRQSVWGGTVQLLLHPVDRLSILAGGRWDKSKTTNAVWSTEFVPGDLVKAGDPVRLTLIDTKKFVPQIGATFELMPELNLYGNYGKSFTPQFGVTFEGDPVQPEEGSQLEGGIKGNFGSVTATLAIFDVKRTHIAAVDPDHIGFSRDIGTQESKGVEVDIFGNILPGWSVYGSFAYLDAHIIASGKPLDVGARLFNVPKFSFSLYTDYQFQKGPLTGLGFGGGVVSRQDRVWGLPSFPWLGRQVDGGSYTTVDLRAYYEIGHVMFDVKVNNVTNEKYYNAFFPGLKGGIFPGRPREFVGSVKYNF